MKHNDTDHAGSAVPPLRLLFWESTSRCNLACVHCRRQDVAEAAAKDDLTTVEVRRLLASMATLGRGIFVFSGGEPLMRPDWEELALHAKSLGLITALATNGTLIDAAVAGRIRASGFHRVSISLDGADAATHDKFRGVAGAFDGAMAGIAALRQAGVPVQINATIAAHNIHQLDELYAQARRLGAVALHLFLLVPVGCGVQISDSHQLPSQQYEQVLNWICDRQEEILKQCGMRNAECGMPQSHGHAAHFDGAHASGAHPGTERPVNALPGLNTANVSAPFELKATCAPHYYRIAAQRKLLQGRSRGCLCGISVAFVSHKGEVFPCGYLPVDCGNVRSQDFAEIWRTSSVFADMRKYEMLKGKCGACEFRGICGGCRARAYALGGDYLAQEPFCTYEPGKA